jgi:rhomboid family GlyGly-CTERM serine protease
MQALISTCRHRLAGEIQMPAGRPRHAVGWFEIVFIAILVIANMPLLWGGSTEALAFVPSHIATGEWWRVITHAFVHVSWYHLLLDGSAFLMLCAELRHWSAARRLSAIAICGLGSLVAALTSPILWTQGFSGLSGVAHGLMAISSIEMIRRGGTWERCVGWGALSVVIAKSFIESASGNVVLSFLHFGLMGAPVAACHAGGVVGGLMFVLINRRPSEPAVT